MSDYINRDIAIARLTALEVQNPIATMCDAKRVLADMPAADVATAPQWIKCEDKLPEMQEDVLMLFNANMTVGFLRDIDEDVTFWSAYIDDAFYTDCDESPLCWMPLPERPKE